MIVLPLSVSEYSTFGGTCVYGKLNSPGNGKQNLSLPGK